MYIGLPTFSTTTKYWIYSFLIAILVIFSIATRLRFTTFIVIIMFTILIFLLMNSSTGINYEGSLPNATYPPPPHLGLDGVDLATKYSGRNV